MSGPQIDLTPPAPPSYCSPSTPIPGGYTVSGTPPQTFFGGGYPTIQPRTVFVPSHTRVYPTRVLADDYCYCGPRRPGF